MTSTLILDHLAREFSVSPEQVRAVLEMVDAGLSAPFIGRFRRGQGGGLPEGLIRRIDRERENLVELDRRRGTIVRMLETNEAVREADRARIQTCIDRFELEDLFVPHRRPEPEVQLSLDRGLGALADDLARSVKVAEPPAETPQSDEPSAQEPEESEPEHSGAEAPETQPEGAPVEEAAAASAEPAPVPIPAETAPGATSENGEEVQTPQAPPAPEVPAPQPKADAKSADPAKPGLAGRVEFTPELARVCLPYVRPDRGIHTEYEALAGAMRILSDRLGRDAKLRGLLRRMMRKHGRLSVRATVDDAKLGRHRSLLRLNQPLKQIQGRQLLAIRQAQKERVLTTVLTLDRDLSLAKVRAALGKHTDPAYEGVLQEIARRALEYRLIPTVEADVRLELKERADDEALRFLSQHLRQILLAAPLGPRPIVGVDVSAKGDWTLAPLTADGDLAGDCVRIELGEKDDTTLGGELGAVIGSCGAVALSVGHGKGPRAAVPRMRSALAAATVDARVHIVNEAGLSSYASSEMARRELKGRSVPERMAVSIGRRLQDPLCEILKVDPRHLGLGSEQGLVTKASLKRMFRETIESCTAHVGCDLNRVSNTFLEHIPGFGPEAASKLIARRGETPFENREALRADGLLTEAQWTSATAFLRIPTSSEPLDTTSLHPEQYDLARRLIETGGGSLEESLGRPGVTQGLRRVDFGVDDATWRDLVREIAHPGRDPRPGLWAPDLLDVGADPEALVPGRVLEGIVSNVASFGAFVDIGVPADAMIHISEISDRYVRDARELLHVGQVVRVRVLEKTGRRLSVSLRKVPARERPSGPPRGRGNRREGREDREGRGRGATGDSNVRAARTRRDGIGGAGRGGGRGGARGGPGRGKRKFSRDREERVTAADLEAAGTGTEAFTPFATFFKKSEPESKPQEGGETEAD